MIDEELVRMLVCPETKQPVTLAPGEMVDTLNARIRQGTLRDRGGDAVERPMDAGLLREDGQVLYPVIDDIPRMLIERGIPIDPNEAGAP